MQTILAIDDEEGVRQSYRLILSDAYRLLLAKDVPSGLEALDSNHVDLILLDLTMPGLSGEDFLNELANRGDPTPVIVVTASNSVTSAVEAMKLGARDYIIKPFDVTALTRNAARILEEDREKRELATLREAERKGFESMIGTSPIFVEALVKAEQAMEVDSTVLITGESGTGKDLLARAIHSGGRRAQKAFVPISCCSIPQHLVESELFGHEKGAFTGADRRVTGKLQVADGGTVFLDEIGEMPIEAQAKLLRVLQDHCFYPVGSSKVIEVDLRVIAATNRNLREAIEEGLFREDLYYRLDVLRIEMPPLRKRREDIPELVGFFLLKHGPRVNANLCRLAPHALAKLCTYSWPGNIRELENTIERMLVHHGRQDIISMNDVEALLPATTCSDEGEIAEFDGLPLEEATNRMERYLIQRALDRSSHVQSRAAELLGTTRRILKYKMDQLGIPANQ